jgi:hypothetical protein
MARVRSTNPVGSTPRDVAPDAPIYARWLRAAVGDTALAHDLVTGANSTTAIDHSGAPNGCQLNMPLAAQHLNRSIVSTTTKEYYIIGVPVFVRAGEAGQYRLRIIVTQFGNSDSVPMLETRNSSWVILQEPLSGVRVSDLASEIFSETQVAINAAFEWVFELPVGVTYLLVKRRCDVADTGAALFSWSLDNARPSAPSSSGIFIEGSTLVGSPYDAPASYSVANNVEFYDEEVTAYTTGLSAYVTSRLNRKMNALWEYVTGSRIPGNNAYKGTSTVNNNRDIWTNEALLEFPIAIAALGASASLSGAKPPATSDMQGWIRYPVANSTTPASFCGLVMAMPSFRTSTSDLKATVIFDASTNDSMADWRFDAIVSGLAASAQVAPTQLGTSRFWTATITAIPFNASAYNVVDVRIRNTVNGGAVKHAQMLGACLYFDP